MNTRRTQPLPIDSVQAVVDSAAELVTELPPEQWAIWVMYFLESLDSKARKNGQGCTYIDALHHIQDGVMFWLDEDSL